MLKPKKVIDMDLFHDIKGGNNESESVVEEVKNPKNNQKPSKNDINKYAQKLSNLKGKINCNPPNEDIEHWDGTFKVDEPLIKKEQDTLGDINSLLLRGCYLRNTPYCIGIAVYLGKESKIMMNSKKPPRKVSNLMIKMNHMLYTVFFFQLCIITTFATLSTIWTRTKGKDYAYIDENGKNPTFFTWFIQLLTFWVAYSHMIPISLYVMIEVLKLIQALLIKWDEDIGANPSTDEKSAECKNSDLIEELGQVDFIFSDKTGTLTCNQMIFKSCTVGGKIYVAKPKEEGKDEKEDSKHDSTSNINGLIETDTNYNQLYWEDECK